MSCQPHKVTSISSLLSTKPIPTQIQNETHIYKHQTQIVEDLVPSLAQRKKERKKESIIIRLGHTGIMLVSSCLAGLA